MSIELVKAVAKGMATYVPLLRRLSGRGTGGSVSARYCYSVWLRHLTTAHAHGLRGIPSVVAELGPGDSLGTGLAALLCGADRLYAFDVVRYAETGRNLEILEQMVKLFSDREPIPGDREFPEVQPKLRTYEFPEVLLDSNRLRATLAPVRVQAIRRALLEAQVSRPGPGARISYFVPWMSPGPTEQGTVDMVYSQAVLEHVDDLDSTYSALRGWLKPGGFMSHEIDFRSHGLAHEWNGHWAYSDTIWRWIQGRKPYLLNRQSHSVHVRMLEGHGFQLVADVRDEADGGIPRARLAPRFRHYTDEDLRIRTSLLQAIRR